NCPIVLHLVYPVRFEPAHLSGNELANEIESGFNNSCADGSGGQRSSFNIRSNTAASIKNPARGRAEGRAIRVSWGCRLVRRRLSRLRGLKVLVLFAAHVIVIKRPA